MKIKQNLNSLALGRIAVAILFLSSFLILFSSTAFATPVINSYKPDHGPEGTVVTINGENLNQVQYVFLDLIEVLILIPK